MVKKLQELLNDGNLDSHWNEALDSWETDEIAKVKERVSSAREWVSSRKEQLLSSIKDITDE